METTKTTKGFKKGDEVTYFCAWDDRGTISFEHATVYSCGRKQMVLTNAAGAEMGRHFKPVDLTGTDEVGTYRRMTDEAAQVQALKVAARWLEERRALLVSYFDFPAYTREGIQKRIDELHEPRWHRR